MHATPRTQSGMTGIGWLIVLSLVGFFALLALRLVPAYLEFYKIAAAMESLQKESGLAEAGPGDIRKMLGRRFDVNEIRRLQPEDVKIERQAGKLRISVAYEVREPMLGNVGVVVDFKKQVDLVSR